MNIKKRKHTHVYVLSMEGNVQCNAKKTYPLGTIDTEQAKVGVGGETKMDETSAKVGGALLDLGVGLPFVRLGHVVDNRTVSQERSTLFNERFTFVGKGG